MPSSGSTHLSFAFDGMECLRDELQRAFVAISVTLDRVRTPLKLVLWREDGNGVAIWSEMHDLAPKIEVGVLKFEMTAQHKEKAPDGFWETVENFSLEGLNGNHLLNKLVIEESGHECESGVILTPSTGRELVLVADAFPCHVAVLGIEELRSGCLPEYELTQYKRIGW